LATSDFVYEVPPDIMYSEWFMDAPDLARARSYRISTIRRPLASGAPKMVGSKSDRHLRSQHEAREMIENLNVVLPTREWIFARYERSTTTVNLGAMNNLALA